MNPKVITATYSPDHLHIIVHIPATISDTPMDTIPLALRGDEGTWRLTATRAALEAIFTAYPGKKMRIDAQLADLLPAPFTPKNVYLDDLEPIPFTVTTPWHHQIQAFHFIKDRNWRALLDVACGGGKTKIAIDSSINMHALRTLILCPKAVVDNWPDEIALHWPDQSARKVCAISPHKSTIAERAARLADVLRTTPATCPLIIIMSHDTAKDPRVLAVLLGVVWDLAVVDESHKIKDPSTVLAKACYKIRDQAVGRLAMSGTAFGQIPLDVYGQLQFTDPKIFNMTHWKYLQKYGEYGGYNDTKLVGITNVEDFNRKLARGVFSVSKDVLDTLPVTHEVLNFNLSEKARKIYTELDQNFTATIGAAQVDIANGAVRLAKLLEISSGFVIDTSGAEIEVDTGKQELLEAKLDQIGDAQVVVFCYFKHDLRAVAQSCMKLGISVCELSGSKNQLDGFKAGHYQVIAVQIQSGGAGINLTCARYGIYYSAGQKVIDFEQSQSRLDRPGQKAHVLYSYLCARDSRDAIVYAALRARRDVITAVRESMQGEALVS